MGLFLGNLLLMGMGRVYNLGWDRVGRGGKKYVCYVYL